MKKPSTKQPSRAVKQLTESQLAIIIGGQGVDIPVVPHTPPKG